MRLEKLVVGQLATNCYLVWDDKSQETIIIDPGDDADFIIRKIQDWRLEPKLIVATHGHFDHILAVTELKLAFAIPFLIHQADHFLLKQVQKSAKHFLGIDVDPAVVPDRFIKDGEIIKVGNIKLKVIGTPGHTPGSISLLGRHPEFISGSDSGQARMTNEMLKRVQHDKSNMDYSLFTGDTLFADGVGRADFSYSSKKELEKSLKRLSELPAKTVVYPGHGISFFSLHNSSLG